MHAYFAWTEIEEWFGSCVVSIENSDVTIAQSSCKVYSSGRVTHTRYSYACGTNQCNSIPLELQGYITFTVLRVFNYWIHISHIKQFQTACPCHCDIPNKHVHEYCCLFSPEYRVLHSIVREGSMNSLISDIHITRSIWRTSPAQTMNTKSLVKLAALKYLHASRWCHEAAVLCSQTSVPCAPLLRPLPAMAALSQVTLTDCIEYIITIL